MRLRQGATAFEARVHTYESCVGDCSQLACNVAHSLVALDVHDIAGIMMLQTTSLTMQTLLVPCSAYQSDKVPGTDAVGEAITGGRGGIDQQGLTKADDARWSPCSLSAELYSAK